MNREIPGYRRLLDSGELEQRVIDSYRHLSICDVCALNCPVDRKSGKLGACRTGVKAKVSSYTPHHGEEYPLSGWKGSGTIFFTRCNLKCQYCQNHDISQTDSGNEVSPEDIADMMIQLQAVGCHNINFVSPSHVVPQIIAGVLIAARAGLHIPLVYNTGGYDSLSMLMLLDGIIDIYMPDMKYGDSAIAQKFSKIPKYTEINQAAVKEMHRQVGDLQIDLDGLAVRGLLVRHLVLPKSLSGTDKVVQFLVTEISKDTYFNLMDQYRPAYKANLYPELDQQNIHKEYQAALKIATEVGLHHFDLK
jgi:putative pyruvate formate lyase activating enzyme